MITTQSIARHPASAPTWQRELAAAVTSPDDLLRRLELDPARFEEALDAAARRAADGFPLRVPESYVRRMRARDARDPLLLQVLPLGRELARPAGFSIDPLGEAAARRTPGLLQKYAGRALLIATGACAVHCRYCFRRDYDYAAEAALQPALDAIAADASIEEVILSGGDPLVLSDRRLAALLQQIGQMPHVQRVRIHTRTPIVLPSRVDAGLLAALEVVGSGASLVIVVHTNHAAELDEQTGDALRRLGQCGATLLNQSVLLRDINDSVDALRALSQRLIAARVLPYYLHLLDPVEGVAHFDVPEDEARGLMQRLTAVLPGYLVPRLVRERAGEASKTPIDLRLECVGPHT